MQVQPATRDEKIALYRSLFRGREDIFARNWQKGNRSGYAPAYSFDWDEFNSHRANGGTLKNFKNKQPIPLNNAIVSDHLAGRITVGLYPILDGNMSYFLAADFDGEGWFDEASKYSQYMQTIGLSAYTERSRSGHGAHVWIFFEEPYPCYKSRSIGLEAARKVFGLSAFDKEASFDRLFPSQDTITQNGLGNLIALPFQGTAVKNSNTVFINPDTHEPYEDQFTILQNIKKHTTKELDNARELVLCREGVTRPKARQTKQLEIALAQNITLHKEQLTPELVEFLKEQLNFINTEYLTKKRLGKSLYKVQKYFRLIDETTDTISLPRGFLSKLINFLQENNIQYVIAPTLCKTKNCTYKNKIKLRAEQESIINTALQENQGVIVAPPGSGKTIMGLEIIARREKPALILVHRKQLLDQWIERIEANFGIPRTKIGQFSGTKKKPGEKITVGLIQSISKTKDVEKLGEFGTVIVDECHHIPAKTFREVVARFNPEFLYGLTATPIRKFNDEYLIFVYIGDIIAELEIAEGKPSESKNFDIIVKDTSLSLPYDWRIDHFDIMAKTISYDTARNKLIASCIMDQVTAGRKTLVLSERKEHLYMLELYLRGKCETTIFSGDDSSSSRKIKIEQIKAGHFQVLLATGQIFGEGMDVDCIESLVLAFPFKFEGKLTQYIGRLNHSTSPKALIDFHDAEIPFLDRQFKSRKKFYTNMSVSNP